MFAEQQNQPVKKLEVANNKKENNSNNVYDQLVLLQQNIDEIISNIVSQKYEIALNHLIDSKKTIEDLFLNYNELFNNNDNITKKLFEEKKEEKKDEIQFQDKQQKNVIIRSRDKRILNQQELNEDQKILLQFFQELQNCSQQKALQSLIQSDWDIESAIDYFNKICANEQTEKKEENKQVKKEQQQQQQQQKQQNIDYEEEYKYQHDEQNQKLLKSAKQNFKVEDQDILLIMQEANCEFASAERVLIIFEGDILSATNSLKGAIKICRGDEQQAVNLLDYNLLEIGAYNRLLPCQKQALDYIGSQSENLSKKALVQLQERCKKLIIPENYIEKILKYIRDTSEIIIHFSFPKVWQFFLKDTHYRNQFETNSSGGTLNHKSRIDWENQLFNNHYNGAKPFERCKYGSLNIFNNPRGVKECHPYGKSFMVLKEVKLRSTFVSGDSANLIIAKQLTGNIATCQYYAHVLNQYSDNELKQLVDIVILGQQPSLNNKLETYKEVQIHGEIELNKHVQSIYWDKSEMEAVQKQPENKNKSFDDLILQLAQKHPNILFMKIE